MDIEKLIEKANHLGMELKRDGGEFEYSIGKKFLEYATALSTLQAENAKLRAEMEQKEKYYEQMVDALAATESAELEQVKAERDAAIDCINQIQSAQDHTRPAYVVDSILHNWKSRK